MSVLGVTLARGGSKGVPMKHALHLCGMPLLYWTIDEVKKCQFIDDYFFSSDDAKLRGLAESRGARTIMRPKELAQDTTPTLPALIHAVTEAEKITGKTYDYIAEIRATSPLKRAGDIDDVIRELISSGADSAIGVTPLEDHHPARAKWLDGDGHIRDFVPEPESGRRQDLTPKAYVRNGTVYALKREWVMGDRPKLFGHEKSVGVVMPPERSINIDTPIDWALAEVLMGKLKGHV